MLWMKVTNDEYQLPIAVAGTAAELAKILGIDVDKIHQQRYTYKRGKSKRLVYVTVEEGDEDAAD